MCNFQECVSEVESHRRNYCVIEYLLAHNRTSYVTLPKFLLLLDRWEKKHIRNLLQDQTTVLLKPVFSHCSAVETLLCKSMWAATSLCGFSNFQSCCIKGAGACVLPYSTGTSCFWMYIISFLTCWCCCLRVHYPLCKAVLLKHLNSTLKYLPSSLCD